MVAVAPLQHPDPVEAQLHEGGGVEVEQLRSGRTGRPRTGPGRPARWTRPRPRSRPPGSRSGPPAARTGSGTRRPARPPWIHCTSSRPSSPPPSTRRTSAGRPASSGSGSQLIMASSTKSLTTSRAGAWSRSTTRQFWAWGEKVKPNRYSTCSSGGRTASCRRRTHSVHGDPAAGDDRVEERHAVGVAVEEGGHGDGPLARRQPGRHRLPPDRPQQLGVLVGDVGDRLHGPVGDAHAGRLPQQHEAGLDEEGVVRR